MNVEEGMELLRDPKVWNVSLAPRPGVFAKSRPTAWQFAAVGFATVAAVAIVTTSAVLLSSLQATPPPAAPITSPSSVPTRTPEPSETPKPSETPEAPEPPLVPSTERTGLNAPAVIFGGDCSEFISTGEMGDIANIPVEPYAEPDDMGTIRDSELRVYAQLGAMVCEWHSDEGSISLTVLREEAAPSTKHDTCASYSGGEAAMMENPCVVDVVANGLRMAGVVTWPTRTESKAIAKRLIAHFESTNAGDAVGPAPAASPGAWPQQTNCESLSPLPLDGKDVELSVNIMGSDAGSLPFEDEIRDVFAAPGCNGEAGADASFTVIAVGDGAWQFDTALDTLDADNTDYSATDLTGLNNAVKVTTNGLSTTYYLVSGPNYLSIAIYGETDDAALIDAIVAKLG